MQKNDMAVIEITDIGVGGEGIGKIDGYTLFVKDAVIGDRAEVKVIKANAHKYSVSAMCAVLQISRSTYYYECKQKPKEQELVKSI